MMIYNYIKKCSIIVFLCLFVLVITSCKNKESKQFNFASYKTADKVPYDIYFDESYFDAPASTYNPHLASASACLALAGFASNPSGNNYSNIDVNAKEFFNVLGFNNYLPNEYGISKPTESSFGVYIASKEIANYTLIGITVRGAGYMAEWASNFNIGNNEEYAQGFFEASTIYLEHLRKYINDFNITGNIKIWTAGYSRGGATVNLAAGRIDDGLVNGENILSDNVKYTKDDIYAYSFEPPAGKIIKSDDNEIFEKGINYSNIYCILNLNDPVPFVAPSDFNFIRYGTDLFLPDIITDLEYEKHLDLVKSRMKDLTNYDVIGDYKIDQFKDESIVSFLNKIKSPYVNVTPYMYLNDFISTLCSALGSKDKYVEVLQNTVMELFKFLYSHVSAKESAINLAINFGKSILLNDSDEVLLYDLQNNPGRLLDDLDPLLLSAFKKIDVNLSMNDVKILTKQLLIVLVNILFSENGFVKLRTLINMTNVGILGSAHIPELLLTHITSLDDNYESSDLVIKNSFNILYLTTDSEFELRINDDKYIYFDDGNINSKLAIKISGNTYMIYIPENTEFEISSNGSYSYELYNHNNSYLNDKLIKQFNN